MKKNEQVKILATAIYLAIKDKQDEELKKVVDNFLVYLTDHRLNFLIPEILIQIEERYLMDNNTVGAEVTAKEKLDHKELEQIIELIKDKSKKKVVIKQQQDDSVLGGVVVKYEDKLLDMSLKNQLNSLAKRFG